ncbi:MAG: hypothetical protein V4719_32120 [Planctomycetota bacterium]
MVGPFHDFLILDRDVDGDWELTKFIRNPRAIQLHDDFVRYIADTLAWIPTVNPAQKCSQFGLCMNGPTIIESGGAATSGMVFNAWADLLSIGPQVIALTGGFSWTDNPALDGEYVHLQFDRNEIVLALRQLAIWSSQVRMGNGRLYLYHDGL